MKLWVLRDNSDPTKYAIVGSSNRPKSAICEAPDGATRSDGKYISVADVPIEEGSEETKKVALLDQAAKDADQAARDAQITSTQYREDRKRAYPSVGDQMDALYKKLHLNDSTEYDAIAAQIAQVKLDHPKPE